jgi:tetratricopeptide (TPR) repeat protein
MHSSSFFLTTALVGTQIALIQPLAAEMKLLNDKSFPVGVIIEHTVSPEKAQKDNNLYAYNSQEEIAALDKAILLNPRNYKAYYNRALLKYEKLNDIKGALADYNQAIIINPKYATAYHHRAILKVVELNDRPGAIKDFRQAAKLHRKQGNTKGFQEAIKALRQIAANH